MRSNEALVLQDSFYYIYYASAVAQDLFFFPYAIGHYYYAPGYTRRREHALHNVQLIYVMNGEATIEYDGNILQAKKGSFVILDCTRVHSYHTEHGYETLWMHFQGQNAFALANAIIDRAGCVINMEDPEASYRKFREIYETFHHNEPIHEARLSELIYDLLCELYLYASSIDMKTEKPSALGDVLSYINSHFRDDPDIDRLAGIVHISRYHFIRVFKKETGLTPHNYIVNLKIRAVKHLLQTTNLPIKDICFETGFSSESVLCAAFKRSTGMSPSEYRRGFSAE
ncbi:MAG: helix-turn-helix transcriptional regulator [Lachnospiraceae bacterium]|nr:helix-turn-helix transcriptional regulator [Lachnospiraceae bacterium]